MDSSQDQILEALSASASVTRREEDLKAVMELTRSLATSDDIFEILFSVVSRLAELLKIDRGSIVLRAEDADSADTAIVVASSDDQAMTNHRLPLGKYPELQQVLESAEPLVIRDVAESPLLTDVIQAEGSIGFSSMALVPIIVESGPIAVLCLKSGARAEFENYDILHAQAVANATAIALNNARTLKELRDETRALFSAHTRDEKKLKELSRYLEIFESSRDAMLVMDRGGQVLFANPMAAQLTHRQTSELVGVSLLSLLKPEARDVALDIVAQFQKEEYPSGIDLELDTPKPGTIASVNFSGVLGESDAVLATMRDVTSQRAMAHELSQTKDFLERVIESSVDGIVSADLRGKVVVYNRAAAKLFGYKRREVIGKMRVHHLYPDGVARDIMRRIRSEEGGGKGRLEEHRVEMVTATGEPIPVNLSASLVLDGKRPVGTVGIFTDIRERLAMESRLAQAQRQLQDRQRKDAIAEVAGAAAHELNQPLTSVMGYAEYLKRAVQDDPSLSHAVDVILSEATRMADIVRKVGRITRYETKPYVGGAKIVDIDRSSTPDT